MSRYIDADRLKEEIDEWLDSVGTALVGKGMSYYAELMGCIDETPTADVVEVVRCRDCKHYVLNTLGIKFCSESRGLTLPYDETFCSYGKRKVQ